MVDRQPGVWTQLKASHRMLAIKAKRPPLKLCYVECFQNTPQARL